MRPEEVICVAKTQEQLTEPKTMNPQGLSLESSLPPWPRTSQGSSGVIYLCPTASYSWLCDPHLSPHTSAPVNLKPPQGVDLSPQLCGAQILPTTLAMSVATDRKPCQPGTWGFQGLPQGTGARDSFHVGLRTEVISTSLKIMLRNTSIHAGGFT